MKTLIVAVMLALTSTAYANDVNGYFRKDGTYVQPHQRSKPDGNPYNNINQPNGNSQYNGQPQQYQYQQPQVAPQFQPMQDPPIQ